MVCETVEILSKGASYLEGKVSDIPQDPQNVLPMDSIK